MQRLKDLDQLKQDLYNCMPLDEFIAIVDGGVPMNRMHDELYKKRCNLDGHPLNEDGEKDTTPSFTVNPKKELFYCFGCGGTGDRVQYVQDTLYMGYVEALRKTAELSGFDLTPYYAEMTEEERLQEQSYKENSVAREIAHQALLNDEIAMNYLISRGITRESISQYKVGYAPRLVDGTVHLFDQLLSKTYLKLHVAKQFNHAILFPVTTPHGKMRYFQSRPFNPIDSGQRYIGADDKHPLFNKEDRFFGFDIMRKKVHQNRGVVAVVEGAPDTIAMDQIGIPTIGTLGTTFNKRSFEQFSKYRIKTAVLVYDGDKAGKTRRNKIAEQYLEFDSDVRLKIAVIPEGEGDPEDYINTNGWEAMHSVVNNAKYVTEYLIEQLWEEMKEGRDITTSLKIDFIWDAQKYVSATKDPLLRKLLINHMANMIGISAEEIEDTYLATASMNDMSLYSPEGEVVILGAMLRDEDYCLDMCMKFDQSDWYLAKHRNLFGILKAYGHKNTDTVFSIVKNSGLADSITYEWMCEIISNVGDVDFYTQDVTDKLIRRKANKQIDMMKRDINDLNKDPLIAIDRGVTDIYQTTYKDTDKRVFGGQAQASALMKNFYERAEQEDDIIGLKLGPNFENLTRDLLGLMGGTMTVVSANQSVGKTQICQNWATWQCIQAPEEERVNGLFMSLEMNKDSVTARNAAIISGLQLRGIMTGRLESDAELDKLEETAGKIAQGKLHISEVGHELAQALSIARRYVLKEKVKVIYIDYVQLQYIGNSRADRHRELGMISKAWKQFALEMNIPVVLISQLSKQALNEDVARAEHGAGSYEIAQDADNYYTMKRLDENEIEDRGGIQNGNILGCLDKNRMGERDLQYNLFSQGDTQQIMEINPKAA